MVTRVLEFQPNCCQALVARAKCYEQCGDLQAALRDITTVLATRPGDRDIQAWRLNINIKLQDRPSVEKPLCVNNDSHDSSSGVSSNLEIAE